MIRHFSIERIHAAYWPRCLAEYSTLRCISKYKDRFEIMFSSSFDEYPLVDPKIPFIIHNTNETTSKYEIN